MADITERTSPTGTHRDDSEIKIVELRKLRLERVILVGVAVGGSIEVTERSLEELRRLTETAGAEVVDTTMQRRARPDAGTFVGKGKVLEVAEMVKAQGADTVIMDDELSPGQLRRLEELVDAKVIDRTALILDIFAQHATSREGKAQVELAQLNYLLPRLRGWGESLNRMGGGIGTRRGPGETKMEVDRRRIRRRITRLRRDLEEMAKTRDVKRRGREQAGLPGVALAGYTNAGKSTLLNRLSGAGVLVEDKLFSTLDPTTRRLDLPAGRSVTLTDTVGFIAKLPHDLVEAFKSTLEEVALADLVVHLVDAAQPEPVAQVEAVRKVLTEVGAGGVPELLVLNKADLVDDLSRARLMRQFPGAPLVSAATGEGIDDLLVSSAETFWTGPTGRARCSRSSIRPRAPGSWSAPPAHWPTRSTRSCSRALLPAPPPAPRERLGPCRPERLRVVTDGVARRPPSRGRTPRRRRSGRRPGWPASGGHARSSSTRS